VTRLHIEWKIDSFVFSKWFYWFWVFGVKYSWLIWTIFKI